MTPIPPSSVGMRFVGRRQIAGDDRSVTMPDGQPWRLVPLDKMTATQQAAYDQGYRLFQHADRCNERVWWLVVDAQPDG